MIRKCIISFGIIMLATLIGAGTLITIYSLPTEYSVHQLRKSITMYQKEGDYPSWASGKASATSDNFTDAIMLRNIIYPDNESIVKNAMLNPRTVYKDSIQTESLIKQLKNEEPDFIVTYSRYWHGYMIILKPLTMIMSISSIRVLNGIFQFLLAVYLIFLLQEKLGKGYGISYLFAYLLLNPITLAMSFQFSTMYYIMSLASIFVLYKINYLMKKQNYVYFFCLVGCLTAYFDFLTYPMVSLGIPLTIFLIKIHQEKDILNKITEWSYSAKLILYSTFFWGIGYGGMYSGKWILTSLLTNENSIKLALSAAKFRFSNKVPDYITGSGSYVTITPVKAALTNFSVLVHEPIFWLSIIIVFWIIRKIYQLKQYHNTPFIFDTLHGSLLFLSIYPIFWYTVLSNHSYIHKFFTYREFSITVFAIGSLLTYMLTVYDRKLVNKSHE